MAKRRMPKMMFDFVDGAAGRELGVELNQSALKAVQLQPRVLRNVQDRTIETTLLGKKWRRPFGIAPMGMCDLTWPRADEMLSKEAIERGFPHCLSTAASTSLEDSFSVAGTNAWFQLYVGPTEDVAWEMIERAERAGYDTLVFTVDVPVLSRRVRDLKNGFHVPFQIGLKQFIDFALHPRWSVSSLFAGVPSPKNFDTLKSGGGFVRGASRAGADWDFLAKLRDRWRGRLLVKGVMSAEDALEIKKAGVDGIYVSNHGGRQLDAAPAAINALPTIRAAVGADYPLIFDSGIRSGEDVVKALALGANFVMLGRLVLYAMGADGARGLSTILDIIEEDISVTLAQIGLTDIQDVSPTNLANQIK
jgi:isopentenyl diphosphate isomerase/L-lactate dehydrogenase-like FMN-dependent dehydrogenase